MQVPETLLDSLKDTPGFDREAFLAVHQVPEAWVSIRVNPIKAPWLEPALLPDKSIHPLHGALWNEKSAEHDHVPWCSTGRYLAERPAFVFDPCWHGGAYYVQEASSMFLQFIMDSISAGETDLHVLELCAAPGGKSTLLASCSSVSLVVANEVIRSRVPVLFENVVKWGMPNTLVSQNDPVVFRELADCFDVLVVDAPCSGSGLFRRDPSAINEWSLQNVAMCSQRQQRILADALPALREGGWLIYSTCSYSPSENEAIADWICEHGDCMPVALAVPDAWGIVTSLSQHHSAPGYRFFPNRLRGEGFFVAVFQKKSGSGRSTPQWKGKGPARLKDGSFAKGWLDTDAGAYFTGAERDIFFCPEGIAEKVFALAQRLHLRKSGLRLGTMDHNRLIPDMELALSTLLSTAAPRLELNREQALQYLRKDVLNNEHQGLGWAVASYAGLPLGLVKKLTGRVNNYYPMAWRIRKSA